MPPWATIAEAIRDGAERLRDVADNPRLEARLLLAHALQTTQNTLIRAPDRVIDPQVFDELVARRQAHEPMALILGRREFWSLDFKVSGATLIPRADSETLVRVAVDQCARIPRRILDLGTGTGCLLLALLHEFPDAHGVGVDIAPQAASLARCNAASLGLGHRSAFLAGHWADALSGRFDLVVSNPPYVRTGDIAGLMPDVRQHEPLSALDGGTDGFDAYRIILPRLPSVLAPRGIAVLELGRDQAPFVAAMAEDAGMQASLHLDYAGIQRAIVLAFQR